MKSISSRGGASPAPKLRTVSLPPRPIADRQLLLAAKRRRERHGLRRLAESRGWIGGFRAPHRDVTLTASDGVRLAASWLPGPDADGPAVVLVHGFAAHRRKPSYAFLADHLAATTNVLSLDLRGHGRSQGRSRLGEAEWRDVQAAVDAVRDRGHQRIVAVGMSLGATAVCHAMARGLEVGGAVLISGSARHWDLALPAMRSLDSLWRSPVKRGLWQAIAGFRMDPPDDIPSYPDPVDLLAGQRTPLLIVHGADDGYFGADHPHALVQATSGPATLWDEPAGFGHAEDGFTPGFCARLAGAVQHVVTHRLFPSAAHAQR